MPHAKSICENMEEFISLHRIQLEQSGIPEHFWNSLFIKLKLEVIVFTVHISALFLQFHILSLLTEILFFHLNEEIHFFYFDSLTLDRYNTYLTKQPHAILKAHAAIGWAQEHRTERLWMKITGKRAVMWHSQLMSTIETDQNLHCITFRLAYAPRPIGFEAAFVGLTFDCLLTA